MAVVARAPVLQVPAVRQAQAVAPVPQAPVAHQVAVPVLRVPALVHPVVQVLQAEIVWRSVSGIAKVSIHCARIQRDGVGRIIRAV